MATKVADPVFVDTNVLVYSRFPASPLCIAASIELEELFRANVPVWASRQILREYASSLTRPQNYRIGPVPIADVIRDILYFESVLKIADESAVVTRGWLALLAAIPCGGKQVHDANIVATMLVHDVPNLLTHNVADFKRFGHLINIIPLVPAIPSP